MRGGRQGILIVASTALLLPNRQLAHQATRASSPWLKKHVRAATRDVIKTTDTICVTGGL
jgi:hypothetical protein